MRRKLPVIAITGKLNTGKDTAAEVLKSLGCISFSFADPLKVCVQELFGYSADVLWGPSQNRTPEVRSILQELGTDFARKYRPNIWIDKMRERIQLCLEGGIDFYDLVSDSEIEKAKGIVVPDVRFPNEAAMLYSDLNAFTIRIVRPGNYSLSSDSAAQHASEVDQENIPPEHIAMTLQNNSTVEQLRIAVRTVGEELLK